MKGFVKSREIIKVDKNGKVESPDLLAIEEPLEIRIGFGPVKDRQQKNLSVTMRTPGHDYELVTGFLFTEGIIESYGQIESINYCENLKEEEKGNVVRVELNPDVNIPFEKLQRHFYTSSSCGVCGKSSIESVRTSCKPVSDELKIDAKIISGLPEKLRNEQLVFEHTGGLHASALFDARGNLQLIREDVGRHNALDKLIGAMLFENRLPLRGYILLVSGRTSFELIQKAAMAGIPVIAAVGAPSSLAAEMAENMGITLIGFLRENRFNIYSHAQRLIN